MGWMAWTWQTALFFALILLALATLTVLAVRWPETPRRGILGFPTTRGDRMFVSLIGSAFIYIAFIRLSDGGNLWYPALAAILYTATMFRFA